MHVCNTVWKMRDTDILCSFPVDKSPSVTVAFEDYKTLENEIYINDVIVDFYLSYLHEKMLNKKEASKIHIFPSMFYKRLLQKRFSDDTTTLNAAQTRHQQVRKWTKKVDLFSKKMIVIPICEKKHWYAIVVVKPDQADRFFVVLDRFAIPSKK